MLTKARNVQVLLAIIFAAGFCVSVCRAETMASYSGRYVLDMEQKQMFLDSIKEDAAKTETELKENADKVKDAEQRKTSHLSIEHINLSELMPSAEKINIAFTATNHMLSPESGIRALKNGKDRTRQ